MPESDEIRIKEEIRSISKTINSILKKIEREREKFKPAGIEADHFENAENPRSDTIKPMEPRTKDQPAGNPSDT